MTKLPQSNVYNNVYKGVLMKLPQSLENEKKETVYKLYQGDSHQAKCLQFACADGFNSGALAVLEKAEKLAEAFNGINLSCSNAGYYGQLGIVPGECKCGPCEAREALTEWKAWRGE